VRPAPRRPRTRLPLYRAERLKHIRAAFRLRIEGLAAKQVARRYRVSLRTVYLWAEAAPTYPDAEAEGLRRALEQGWNCAATG
jgi:transposase